MQCSFTWSMAHFSRSLLKKDKLLTGWELEAIRSKLGCFRRGLLIEVFYPDAKTPSYSEMFTSLVMVGKISSMHSFKSFVGRTSNLHDFVLILRMIFLTSV